MHRSTRSGVFQMDRQWRVPGDVGRYARPCATRSHVFSDASENDHFPGATTDLLRRVGHIDRSTYELRRYFTDHAWPRTE
jgi:hypothetical protein